MSDAAVNLYQEPLPDAVLPDLVETCEEALKAAEALGQAARQGVADMVMRHGKIDAGLLDEHQMAVHGYAWFATYVESLKEMVGWAKRLLEFGHFGEFEALILQAAFGEYLHQLAGGIAMSQMEIVRPAEFGISDSQLHDFYTPATKTLMTYGWTDTVRRRLADFIVNGGDTGNFGALGLEDDSLEMVRDQFRRFVEERSRPMLMSGTSRTSWCRSSWSTKWPRWVCSA